MAKNTKAYKDLDPAEFPDNVNPSPEAKGELDKQRAAEQKEQEKADKEAQEGQAETVNRQ